ncbi:MAG TPA: 3-hydroxyacyl-CoA dehydrogenase family protein [Panacibacter sp.]|nr:3-hydroxyacyl-CoA dehydrogenase family protein [Panacibacter sp.]HNP42866.1 3-hydroxyacyl-CoA dehydrogenase family protein [Panacibacter sp.]
MENEIKEVGVIGLGLMGSSIVAAMMMYGYKVIALGPLDADIEQGPGRIMHALNESRNQGLHHYDVADLESRVVYTRNYADLHNCFLILECVTEKAEIKRIVYEQIEAVVSRDAIVTTNTSAIPITILQETLSHPERFIGMHWAEPAFTTPFLEIICGPKTDINIAESLYAIASGWGKEPTLLRKDIRGFITNRLMYAMYREGFFLVENGYASVEDIDRACRNDAGYWMTFCGLFRYMDLTGLQAYYHVIKDLFPTLSNDTHMPKLIEDIAKQGGNGVTNGNGFYQYTTEEAKEWEKVFEEFNYDINNLARKYPADIVYKRLREMSPGKI